MTNPTIASLAEIVAASICTASPQAKSLFEQMAHPASMITGALQPDGDQSPTINVPSVATVLKSIPATKAVDRKFRVCYNIGIVRNKD
jgi:hypothetical protein